MKRRFGSFATYFMLIIVWSGSVAAGTDDRELLVQFNSPIIEENKGEFPENITGLSQVLSDLFTANGVEYLESVFQEFPSEKIVNGHTIEMPDFSNYYLIRIDSAPDLGSFYDAITGTPEVRSVDYNSIEFELMTFSCASPNDPYYSAPQDTIFQWYLQDNGVGYEGHANVAAAWDIVCDGLWPGEPRIAFFDGGSNTLTLDTVLELNLQTFGIQADGHGTQVAGVAAAISNNGVGLAGVARGHGQSLSYSVRGEDFGTYKTAEQIAKELHLAVTEEGATIISTSAGMPLYPNGFNKVMLKSIQAVFLNGVPFVCASGNGFSDRVSYPGRYQDQTICVGATNLTGERWVDSFYGPALDLCAPGVEIPVFSFDPDYEGIISEPGTSFSQPIVAGAIALMQVIRDDLIAEDYDGVLKSTCKDVLPAGFDEETGWGRVDVGRAVANLTGVYEIQHGTAYASVVDSIELESVTFIGFNNIDELGTYDAMQFELRSTVEWSTSYSDSTFCWGTNTHTTGFSAAAQYDLPTESVPVPPVGDWVVSNLHMSYPDYSTVTNAGSAFSTFVYRVEVGEDIVWLGSLDPDACEISYGVIGKIHDPYPAPIISESSEYPVLTGGVGKSIFAVTIENNGSSSMEVTADLSPLGGLTDQQLFDEGTGSDIEAADGIYTSAPFTSNVAAGSYSVDVSAQGDLGPLGQQSVAVEVIESLTYMADGSGDTGDLTNLAGSPYSGIYFDSHIGGNDEKVMIVTKDASFDLPEVYKQQSVYNGSPDMLMKNYAWFSTGASPAKGSRGIFAADFDNDGHEDFFVCHNDTSSRLYRNTGTGFMDVTGSLFGQAGASLLNGAHTAAWGDYNQDGNLDLFVATMQYTGSIGDLPTNINSATTPQWHLFKNTGDSFEETTNVMNVPSGLVLSASWNDVNDDGLLDLIVGQLQEISSGLPTVILNKGYNKKLGHYELDTDSQTTTTTGLTVNSLEWIDLNHDQYPDLVITQFAPNTGARILRNTGNGFVADMVLDYDGVWTGSVVADYNQDGQDDVILLPSEGMPKMLIGDIVNNSSYEDLAFPLGLRPGQTSGGFSALFDTLGVPGLYLGRSNDDEFLYKNFRPDGAGAPEPGQQNWIRFNLATLGNCNASLIGAMVTVSSGGNQWMQVVDGGSGRGGQRSNDLHFGLGSLSGTVDVTVDWPVSSPTTFSGLAINSVHTLVDNAIPTLDPTHAENFTHEARPDDAADWVFTWVTTERGTNELDEVDLDLGDYYTGQECWEGYDVTLSWGDPDVEMTIYPIPGGWKHQVVWKDRGCHGEEICDFQFRVRSSVGVQPPVQGQWIDFGEFDVCMTNSFPGMN